MNKVIAKSSYLLLHDDGVIHYPFSKYLTHEFSNPNTRELVGKSLGIFYRFCSAHCIELAVRAFEGRCLTYDECTKLAGLCYRPLEEFEVLSHKNIIQMTGVKSGKLPENLPGAVTPNTAKSRLNHIAKYLEFYLSVFLHPNIRSRDLCSDVSYEYEKTINYLNKKIKGTKQNHYIDIKSIPAAKFLEIIKAIYIRPEALFVNKNGKLSRTIRRDRAMALLACEGLRPGEIGNLARSDLRLESQRLVIIDHRDKRSHVTSSTPLAKLGASTKINSATERMIELWPFTIEAIRDYIDFERNAVLGKKLKNKSNGFLFLNEKGESIKDRSSISAMFASLKTRLSEEGLLAVGKDPYFSGQKQYDFYPYVCRHSSASLYIEVNGNDDRVLDTMKSRYGWQKNSEQPLRYAARALSEKANIDLMDYSERLMDEAKGQRQRMQGK